MHERIYPAILIIQRKTEQKPTGTDNEPKITNEEIKWVHQTKIIKKQNFSSEIDL